MRVVVGIVAVAIVAGACGSTASDVDPNAATPAATIEAPSADPLRPSWTAPVPADAVEVVGELDATEVELVGWALTRFEEAGLRLPRVIEVEFAGSEHACHGCDGLCHVDRTPPGITICAPAGTSAHRQLARRIAVLHELAHLWHRARGGGVCWPDVGDIVGGEVNGSRPWEDRMRERVAVVISWGLLDQLRRPVRSDLPCATLHRQFVELTGRPPLGPLEAVCDPEAA